MRMYSTIDSQGYERINTYDVNEGDIISFDIHNSYDIYSRCPGYHDQDN